MTILSGPSEHPIFSRCPALRERLPHVPLGDFPTPVEKLDALGRQLGVRELWVKRDDRTSSAYGGNKVRKLEFLLGDALRMGAREVVTMGAAGSNHALATTIHAARLGMPTTLFLTPQPASDRVRGNLLLDLIHGANVLPAVDSDDARAQAQAHVEMRRAEDGVVSYLIPLGGTNPTSVAGMTDAGLELVMQAFQGECLLPDVVYVAMGSMGTAAGIALGLAISRVATEVRAVRVTPESLSSAEALFELVEDTRDLMCALDSACDCTVDISVNATIVDDFFAPGYGAFDPRVADAVALAREHGLVLDDTYTGKAFAALIADAAAGALAGARVLFWDTFNSYDLTPRIQQADFHRLPEEFHRYFME